LRQQDLEFASVATILPLLSFYNPHMVRLSIMCPAASGSSFDWNYYLGPHRALAQELLSSRGLLRMEIDRGICGFPAGTPAHFHAVGHLFFSTMTELERALAATAAEFIADQRRYFSGESIVQVSEVVEAGGVGERRETS
jgi:uncharacterized protein (TIGR02118 family)